MFLKESTEKYLRKQKFIHEPQYGKLFVNGSTNVLDIYFAGLGMNHNVFLYSFDEVTKFSGTYNNLLALTLSGFNEYIQINSQNRTINPFNERQQILNAVVSIVNHIEEIKRRRNISIINVNLFGFSYGADLLCGIAKELLKKKITINKLVFSDVNLNQDTAFLTGQITQIENELVNSNERNKKGEFIKRVIDNSDDDKILDNLEYLRISYNVNWDQMVLSSQNAFEHCEERIIEIRNFLNSNTNIKCCFFISNSTLNNIENGYELGIQNIMNQTTNFNRNIEYHSTNNHFDGISYATIFNVNRYFYEN